ncbi:tyrosine-type recombinase/integrase [Methylobacterium fujisawaense]
MSKAATLELHDNGKYYVHWIDGRRTLRVSTRTSDLAEAQEWFGGWLLGQKQRADKKSETDLTFSEVWASYVKEVVVGTPSEKRMPAMTPRFEKAFGPLLVSELTQAHVDKYVANRRAGRMGKPAADSTIWLELTKVKAAVSHAVKRKRLPASARLEIDMPEPPEARDRWLRPDEFAKLVEAARAKRRGDRLSRIERFLMIAVETGARCRVIETLTWDRVDFETGVIHYRAPGDARSKKKRPSVPISKALRPVLERAYKERTGDLVLDAKRAVYMALVEVAEDAGVKGVSPHVLRHTAATWMARRGVPLWKIAGILGNSVRMVEEVYAKHSPDGLADAVEMISGNAPVALAA